MPFDCFSEAPAMPNPSDILVEKSPAACGGDGDSPHPKVFLDVAGKAAAACPYCGKRYALKRDTQ